MMMWQCINWLERTRLIIVVKPDRAVHPLRPDSSVVSAILVRWRSGMEIPGRAQISPVSSEAELFIYLLFA